MDEALCDAQHLTQTVQWGVEHIDEGVFAKKKTDFDKAETRLFGQYVLVIRFFQLFNVDTRRRKSPHMLSADASIFIFLHCQGATFKFPASNATMTSALFRTHIPRRFEGAQVSPMSRGFVLLLIDN